MNSTNSLHNDEVTAGCALPRTKQIRHRLKTVPAAFWAVCNGSKKHELRKNDRCFKVGDELLLEEWDADNYTGNQVLVRVTYITPGGRFGLPEDLCVMSIKLEVWAFENHDAKTDFLADQPEK